MANFSGNSADIGNYNNYVIAGNITKNFAIGEIGSETDFYFIGFEPPAESQTPLLSGNIFDSNGTLLFKLVRNAIINNPTNCYKIFGDYIGYEIVDSEGKLILKVETKYDKIPGRTTECFLTTIKAKLYNNKGQLVFDANSGDPGETVAAFAKFTFGSRSIVHYYSKDELQIIDIAFRTKGKVYSLLQGAVSGQTIEFDGKFISGATVTNCRVIIRTGDFIMTESTVTDCTLDFQDNAGQIYTIAMANS